MRVLLTGGAGFIGTHVLAELRRRDHDVVVLDSLRADVHRGAPPKIDGLVIGDVRDRDVLDDTLDGVDVVCHLAAKVGLGVDVADLPDYADTNVHGTAAVLAGMARRGVGRLVQASSMVVYGEGFGHCPEHGAVRPGPRADDELAAGRFEAPCSQCGRDLEPMLVAEDVQLDPRSAYAASKVGQEQFASAWARATGGSAVSLRYHNVYGPGLPEGTPYAGVAALFLTALRRGEAPTVYEDGGQRRDFVHVADIAAATVCAVEQAGLSGTTAYNIGSGTPRTVGQMADALARAIGGPAPVVTGAYRLGDVRHITADSSAARAALGWRPEIDFDAGMVELAG